jgi:hypothetical protein
MKEMPMPEPVRYRNKGTQFGTGMLRYRTERLDAGMPMAAASASIMMAAASASASMPMPSYGSTSILSSLSYPLSLSSLIPIPSHPYCPPSLFSSFSSHLCPLILTDIVKNIVMA